MHLETSDEQPNQNKIILQRMLLEFETKFAGFKCNKTLKRQNVLFVKNNVLAISVVPKYVIPFQVLPGLDQHQIKSF